jgi:hypothetical protein
MTNQEFFDSSCKHFAKQKQRCIDKEGICKLRIETGNKKEVLKCIVGKYIKKSEIHDFESMSFQNCRQAVAKKYNIDYELLKKIQVAHDRLNNLQKLREELQEIANDYELNACRIELIAEWK